MSNSVILYCAVTSSPRLRFAATFAGAERRLHDFQTILNCKGEGVLATKHAPRGQCRLLEHRHGLAEIVERGAGVLVECLRVNPPHPEREGRNTAWSLLMLSTRR